MRPGEQRTSKASLDLAATCSSALPAAAACADASRAARSPARAGDALDAVADSRSGGAADFGGDWLKGCVTVEVTVLAVLVTKLPIEATPVENERKKPPPGGSDMPSHTSPL